MCSLSVSEARTKTIPRPVSLSNIWSPTRTDEGCRRAPRFEPGRFCQSACGCRKERCGISLPSPCTRSASSPTTPGTDAQDLDRAAQVVREYVLQVVERGLLEGQGTTLSLPQDEICRRRMGPSASGMIETMCRCRVLNVQPFLPCAHYIL